MFTERFAYNGKEDLKGNKRMRGILWVVLAMVFLPAVFFHGIAHAVDVKGEIATDTVWTKDLSPYVITGNVLIAGDVALRIEQGVIIEFETVLDSNVYHYHIEVNGTLDARGSGKNPIVFTTEDKDHYWDYIEFTEESTAWDEASSSGCILSHCIIEYAGNGEGGTDVTAAIRSVSASPMIRNCIIRYSKTDGIYTESGAPNIFGNRIHDTVCGIRLITPEGGLVENNYLINNEQGIYLETGADIVEIRNNTVKSSSSEIYGGCLGVNLLYHDDIASYFWEQIAGPKVKPYYLNNSVLPYDPNDAIERTFAFTAPDDIPEDELLTYQLTVTDKAGLISVDTVNINVKVENIPPVAGIVGPRDQTVAEGFQVVLDGSDSFDQEDGGSLSYAWEQTSGPVVTLSNASSEHCTFIAPTGVGPYGETYIFQLTVTDSGGLQSKDRVNIHVVEEDHNEAPVADAGLGQTVTEGDSVTLDGSGSADPEDAIISWLWRQIEGPDVDISDSTSQKAGFTAPEVGREGKSLIFELIVTDDAFQEGSDRIIVNVVDSDPNDRHLPLVSNAGPDQEVNDESTVNLNGSATDPNGALDTDPATLYYWEQISGLSVPLSGTGKDRSFTPDVKEDEELIFRLTVTDKHGLKSDDSIRVKVKFVNKLPVADARLDPDIIIEEGLKVYIDGSYSCDPDFCDPDTYDPDGPESGIASYVWEQISGPEVILSGNTIEKPKFIVPEVTSTEQLIFQLTVTDRSGGSAQDTVSVNITPEKKPPVADAGQDLAVTGGTDVTLDGSGSYDPEDPDHGIVSYLWEEVSNQWEQKDITTVTLYDATTLHPHFVAPQLEEGEDSPGFQPLTFLLTVRDKDGMESWDSVVVNVTGDIGANRMPVADAGPDKTVARGAKVILDGSGSRDPDVVSEVNVSNNHFISDDSEGIGNTIAIKEDTGANSLLSITANNLENLNGNFMVYLHNWADKDSVPVDMRDNWWGTASVSKINSMIYDHGDDEFVPQVNFDPARGAEISGAGSDLPYPPMADGGEDQDKIEPDDIVTLDGSGTYDPDNIMSYKWTQTEGQKVTIHNAWSASATFIAPSPGDEDDEGDVKEVVLRFKLTVTDSEGFYDTDEVIVKIKITASEEDVKRQTSSGCFISSVIFED